MEKDLLEELEELEEGECVDSPPRTPRMGDGSRVLREELGISSFYGWFPEVVTLLLNSTPKVEDNRAVSQENSTKRPQDAHREFAKRRRQLNLNKIDYTSNPRSSAIISSTLSATDYGPRNDWNTYKDSHGKPNPHWVTTAQQLRNLIRILERENEFAFDMKVQTVDTKDEYIALLQISTWTKGDYLIDPLPLHKEVCNELKQVLESDSITKIIHGCGDKVVQLRKNYLICLVKVMDTQDMYSTVNGKEDITLADLCRIFYPNLDHLMSVDETFSDFRATNNVHYLLRVYDQMRSICISKGPLGEFMLQQSFNETKNKLLVKITVKPNVDGGIDEWLSDARMDLINNHGASLRLTNLSAAEKQTFKHLLEWRHDLANLIDIEDARFVSNIAILEIATRHPTSLEELGDILGQELTKTIEKQQNVLLKIVLEGEVQMEELRNKLCYKCRRFGHISALCWLPESFKGNFYKRPENDGLRRDQKKKKRVKYCLNKWIQDGNDPAEFDPNNLLYYWPSK